MLTFRPYYSYLLLTCQAFFPGFFGKISFFQNWGYAERFFLCTIQGNETPAPPPRHRIAKGGEAVIWKLLGCAALTAALALMGLLLRCWALLPLGSGAVTLLEGRGDGGELEQNLRSFLLLKRLGLVRHPVVILTDGLSPEGLALAERLAAAGEVRLLRWQEAGSLAEILERCES